LVLALEAGDIRALRFDGEGIAACDGFFVPRARILKLRYSEASKTIGIVLKSGSRQ
jgi:hypothetical protein